MPSSMLTCMVKGVLNGDCDSIPDYPEFRILSTRAFSRDIDDLVAIWDKRIGTERESFRNSIRASHWPNRRTSPASVAAEFWR
jgi:hypothetical protein